MNRSTVIAALIISGAILLNGYLDRQANNPRLDRPSDRQVRKSVIDSFGYAFKTLAGENVIMDKKRDVKSVQINDIRYSEGNARMLVEFTIHCADGDDVSSAIGLDRDPFGVYQGAWEFGNKRALFNIKK